MGLFTKILLRLFRVAGLQDKTLKIRKGPLAGKLWSVKITDSRYIAGDYEPVSSLILSEMIHKGDVVFDIGANAGYFTMLFKELAGVGKVFAFEPLPVNIELLSKHLEINNAADVKILPVAVADKSGEIVFSHSGNPSANTYKTESSVFNNASSKISVQGKSLDDLVYEDGLPVPQFLKIDVEGAELDVLKGAVKLLSDHKPSMLLATHDCHVPGVAARCITFLESAGYSVKEAGESKEVEGQQDFIAVPK